MLNVTQDIFIGQTAAGEDIDATTVHRILKSAETAAFNRLPSAAKTYSSKYYNSQVNQRSFNKQHKK